MKDSLYNTLINHCDNFHSTYKCNNCSRDNGRCSGGCSECSYEIHRNGEVRTNYDCEKLTSYYVCRFLNKYASEALHALECDFLKEKILQNKRFNVLSLGCGPSSDYIAFNAFRNQHCPEKMIHYKGIDISTGWDAINKKINKIKNENDKYNIFYQDVFEKIKEKPIKNTNILVIQNLFSTLNKKNDSRFQNSLETFFDDLNSNIIKRRAKNLIIIINDINSWYCARDKWINTFRDNIAKNNIKCETQIRYFDNTNCKHKEDFWQKHNASNWFFKATPAILIYQTGLPKECTGVQLLIKIGGNNDN